MFKLVQSIALPITLCECSLSLCVIVTAHCRSRRLTHDVFTLFECHSYLLLSVVMLHETVRRCKAIFGAAVTELLLSILVFCIIALMIASFSRCER